MALKTKAKRELWAQLLMISFSLFLLVGVSAVESADSYLTTTPTPITELFNPTTENNFPLNLTFRINVTTNREIDNVKLFLSTYDGSQTQRLEVNSIPNSNGELEYILETTGDTSIPSTPYLYYWQITDREGNITKSDQFFVRYDDVRFDWQRLENDNIVVLWHDQPDDIGEKTFAAAVQAYEDQADLFQTDYDIPLHIILYNSFDEFAAWQTFTNEWVGGQAFPNFGITAFILSAYNNDEWLNDVVPHELSHLFLYRSAHHPLQGLIPAWFNEGLAVYHEQIDNQPSLDFVKREAAAGNLISLRGLTTYGNKTDRVRLAYPSGLSAVTYLIETYGKESIATILASLKEGTNFDTAFTQGTGTDIDTFQIGWIEWLGIDPALYPTPKPQPTSAPIPTAAMMMVPTAKSAEKPTATVMTTKTPVPTATSVPLEPTQTADEVEVEDNGRLPLCTSALIPLLGLAAFFNRRKRNLTP